MNIELLVVDLQLEGCASLKEKRQRLVRLKDRFGKLINVAVCESDYQDVHKKAQWSFVAVGLDGTVARNTLTMIEQAISTEIDAVIIHIHRESL